MKTSIVYTIIALLMINTLSGQVKIGNNPESLDPASVLELESNTRVLVITRVTDAQMSVINPLPGALAYNTDQDCLHYYDGTQWVNICEELDNSFTVSTRADYLSQLNPQARDSTVIITTTVNPDDSVNYNFEVAQITGANIVNTSINGASKLQDDSVTSAKLADGSVTLEKLADATTGQPGDLFQWNGINWTLINESALGITEKDSIVGNEVVGPTDATLLLSGAGSQADPLTLDVAPLGIDTAELADAAVTTTKIADGNVTDAKLDKTNIPLSGFGAAGAAIDLGNQIIFNLGDPTNPLDAVNLQTLNAAILASNQTIVSTDTPNSITTGSDGGAIYDDTALQTSVTNNTNNITTNQTNIAQNATDIAAITIVSSDAPNSITTGLDGGAIYDDTALQTSVTNNTNNITTNQTNIAQNAIDIAAITIVSSDAPNSITTGSDGGAIYDDTALQTSVTNNTNNITTNQTNIAQNATDIAAITIISSDAPNSITTGSDGGAIYDDTALQTSVTNNTNNITTNQTNIAQNATDIAAITIVSSDAPNSITTGSDGGAIYDDTALQTSVTNNTNNITTNQTNIAQNATDIAAITIVSSDAPNSITTGSDGGAIYDDTALQTSVTNNTNNITTNQTNIAQNATDIAAITIVSSDAPNSITTGSDGGAYLNATVKPITVIGDNITLTDAHYTIILDNSGNLSSGFSIPAPTDVTTGKIFVIRNNSGGSVDVWVEPTSLPPFNILNDGEALWVQTDGSNWYQIN